VLPVTADPDQEPRSSLTSNRCSSDPDPLLVVADRSADNYPPKPPHNACHKIHRRGDRDAGRCPPIMRTVDPRLTALAGKRLSHLLPTIPTRDSVSQAPASAVRPDPGADRALRASEAQRFFDDLLLIDPTP
jgi:hypothetical protein